MSSLPLCLATQWCQSHSEFAFGIFMHLLFIKILFRIFTLYHPDCQVCSKIGRSFIFPIKLSTSPVHLVQDLHLILHIDDFKKCLGPLWTGLLADGAMYVVGLLFSWRQRCHYRQLSDDMNNII